MFRDKDLKPVLLKGLVLAYIILGARVITLRILLVALSLLRGARTTEIDLRRVPTLQIA